MSRPFINKKRLRLIILAAAGISCIPLNVAQAAVYGGGGFAAGLALAAGIGGIVGATSISSLIMAIINFILNLILILAILAIIIAGIYLITSGGEEGQKDKAKKIIYYALIGIVVVLLSRVIVMTVNSLF